LLPASIAVQWAVPIADDFHARYSALGRTYCYLLHNHPVRPAVLTGRIGWFHAPLDASLMRAASRFLLGEHDFSAFRSSECQAKTPVRVMQSIDIVQHGTHFIFEFTANAFLHHMVRNIVGCLIHVGKGKHPAKWMAELLAGRDRTRCAPTFSPDGLYLAGVRYPEPWQLPAFDPMIPLFAMNGKR
jgi:tRNA pseudouridine38-40 synthase